MIIYLKHLIIEEIKYKIVGKNNVNFVEMKCIIIKFKSIDLFIIINKKFKSEKGF